MTQLVTYGERGSSALARREDLFSYYLQVDWSDVDKWRETQVVLPSGRAVGIDQYVGANAQRPRMFHPEYALAIELLLANAVVEAKERGFRVAAVELGLWPYRTLTTMGKRVTKIGLAEPMLLEDGRTESHTGYMWIDHEGEGVLIVPWANGDQLIRLKDSRGHYVVPVDERTADAKKCLQFESWRKVKDYPQLPYDGGLAWVDVPLLESGDEMVEHLECQHCLFLFPLQPWPFAKDIPSGKRACKRCREVMEAEREAALAQGWDYDKGERVKRAQSFVTLPKDMPCQHKPGMQMRGTLNVGVSEEKRSSEGMKIFYECILCGEPTPDDKLTKEQAVIKKAQADAAYNRG